MDDNDNVGIQANLSFSANATFDVTIVGAVRAMRDYVEGPGTMHEIFNYTLESYKNSTQNATVQSGSFAELLDRFAPDNPSATGATAIKARDTVPYLWMLTLLSPGLSLLTSVEPGELFNAHGALADLADTMAEIWEEKAPQFFEVTMHSATAEQRLVNFVNKVNLTEALLNNGPNVTGDSNKTFYALSLMEDGSPVQVSLSQYNSVKRSGYQFIGFKVLNSDLGFNLLFWKQYLLTNIGMVVANPAYDSNTTNFDVLNRAAYHGTVVWSWQQGVTAAGLNRQLSFCSNSSISNSTVDSNLRSSSTPVWCSDAAFVQDVVDAQLCLWTSIKDIFSEVWTYAFDNVTDTFEVADLASVSPDGTDSEAIQLWSYGFLGILDPNGQLAGR
ncbi:hypothetical protein EW145_g3307 [Phellinidium pouzarii]|uniref:Uncharacterized protein n=1 Tax=Phellinidium pouzarii TaxID=167371 RepID=A0A4S4L7Z6_9AGAM|nr:hypothetical protein EW145_g3307 [Phellinidium pouzarii]